MDKVHYIDSNVLIEANNRYYGMDICPGFWRWLDLSFESGRVTTVPQVMSELTSANDNLASWVKEKKPYLKVVNDEPTQKNYANIAEYINGTGAAPEHIESFLGGADGWLIASAMREGDAVIVTQEIPVGENSRKVKIPNVCSHFEIKYIGTFELLKFYKAQLVLDKELNFNL
jgi:hypothetical protein